MICVIKKEADRMKKGIIEIYINEKEDYENRFHSERLSQDLSDYILAESRSFPLKADLEIHIFLLNDVSDLEKERIQKLIYENYCMDEKEISLVIEKNKIVSFLLLLVGIFTLFIDLFVEMVPVLSEIILIFGWVFIWEGIYNYFLGGMKNTIRKKRLKKLVTAKILFHKEKAS